MERLTATIGAQVSGFDLSRPRTAAEAADIRSALLLHKVLVFRGQDLTPTAHRDFAATLGELTPAHPVVPGLDEHTEIYLLDGGKSPVWHTDVTFMSRPPLGEDYLHTRLGGEGSIWEGERVTSLKPAVHPVVRIHPETGRRSLFVSPASPPASWTSPRPRAGRSSTCSSP